MNVTKSDTIAIHAALKHENKQGLMDDKDKILPERDIHIPPLTRKN